MDLKRVLIAWALLPVAATLAQDMEIQVELMNHVGTDTSRKGDLISARVLAPPQLLGDMVDGKVSDAKSGAKLGGKSVLTLTFDTLRHAGQAIPLSAEVRSITNSKGQMNTDEEGRAVRSGMGNVAKVAGGAGVGGLIGGLARGTKGAAIGAVAGGAVALVLVEVAADGPNIKLDPGSRLVLNGKSRSGPSLASLSPNTAPAAAPVQAAAAPVQTAAVAPAPPQQAAPAAPSPAVPAAAPSSSQPDLTAISADFIPGEKPVFFDDFSDMAGDEPPPHWKIRGGTPVLKVGGGVRQLTIAGRSPTVTANCAGIPANFTFETEMKYETPDRLWANWWFRGKNNSEVLRLLAFGHHNGNVSWEMHAGAETLGQGGYDSDFSKPDRYALWVQNGRLRLYINGKRVLDVNQLNNLPAIERLELILENLGEQGAYGIRNIRVAESTPDFGQVISSSGRYVTHGILFDTDSDRLKPESAAVIKMIARSLEVNPALKLTIEGHTDSTGNADHNLELSSRRAEAVRAVLISQFQVDSGRLGTAGLGATKPIDSNDTPAGRAQNRRVELVKQ
jgi:OmpA-OmpF porin, OOP family